MPKYTLILRTYSKTIRGKANRLCGVVKTKEGNVVIQKVEDKSTHTELSKALREQPFIPTNLAIPKKGTVQFSYLSNEVLKTIEKERTMPASQLVASLAAIAHDKRVSDKTFRHLFKEKLPITIYDGCEKIEK